MRTNVAHKTGSRLTGNFRYESGDELLSFTQIKDIHISLRISIFGGGIESK
jgi:hypothetical protein